MSRTDHRVGGLISSSLEVSVVKALNLKFHPIVRPAPCMVARCLQCVNGRIRGKWESYKNAHSEC